MVTILNYGIIPFSIVLWHLNGVLKAKTICYSRDEEKTIVERFKKEFDVLSKYSKAEIYDQDGNLVKAIIREGGHYREINTIHSHGRTSRTGQTEIQKKQHKAV